jgi:hypothetical protein
LEENSQVPDRLQLEFEKVKWTDEVRLRQQEIDLKARETEIKVQETEIKSREQQNALDKLNFDQAEARRNRWTNPLVLAVFAAAVAAGGNAAVALLNVPHNEQLNRLKTTKRSFLSRSKQIVIPIKPLPT